MKRFLLPAIASLAMACSGGAEPVQSHDYRVETLVEGLEHPWAIAFLPDGDWLITERPGRLRRVRDGELVEAPLAGGPEVVARGQGGLLDIALHPRFEDNALVYLTYAKATGDGKQTTALGRGRFDGEALQDFEDILVTDARADGTGHYGSRILFDDDGYLFMTVGDRRQRDQAQEPRNHFGATLRLHDDGSAPEDNPFYGSDEGADEIWSWGHRNAQGMALHPQTRQVWQNEHGPRGGDEINRIRRGENYGWPEATHGREYHGPRIGPPEKEGMVSPLKHWTPSIAPSGMTFYTGDRFPQWRGDVFNGALVEEHIARVRFDGLDEVEEERLLEGRARIRDVRTGPDGYLYVLTDEPDGRLLRLVPQE